MGGVAWLNRPAAAAELRRTTALIPAELHGRAVIGVACCWVGEHDRGEAAAMRRFGTPIVDLVSRRPFVEHQGLLDPSFPHGI